MARENERCIPVESVSGCGGPLSGGPALAAPLPRGPGGPLRRAWPNRGRFARSQVTPTHRAVLTLVVHQIGIERIDPHDESVAAGHRYPLLIHGPIATSRERRSAPRTVILQ